MLSYEECNSIWLTLHTMISVLIVADESGPLCEEYEDMECDLHAMMDAIGFVMGHKDTQIEKYLNGTLGKLVGKTLENRGAIGVNLPVTVTGQSERRSHTHKGKR